MMTLTLLTNNRFTTLGIIFRINKVHKYLKFKKLVIVSEVARGAQ